MRACVDLRKRPAVPSLHQECVCVCVRVCVSTSANETRWYSLSAPGLSVCARACVWTFANALVSPLCARFVCACVCERARLFFRPQQTRWCKLFPIGVLFSFCLSICLSVCVCVCVCVQTLWSALYLSVVSYLCHFFWLWEHANTLHTHNRSHTHIHTYTHTHTRFISVLFRLSQGATIDRKMHVNTFNTHSRSQVPHIE